MRWIQLPTSPSRRLLCIGAESGIFVGAFLLAVALRFWNRAPSDPDYPLLFPKAILATIVFQICLYYADLYEDYTSPARVEMLLRLGRAFFAGTVVLALVFYGFPAIRFGRGIVVIFIPLSLAGIVLWR